MDDESIAAVVDSMAAVGIIQNLRVTPDGHGRYKIVAGERRYHGALKAGLTEPPSRSVQACQTRLGSQASVPFRSAKAP